MRRTTLEEVAKTVGRRIAEVRVQRNLSQERLAELLGVTARYLQRVEAGVENLTLGSLVTLANLLDTKVIELLKRPSRSRPTRMPTR